MLWVVQDVLEGETVGKLFDVFPEPHGELLEVLEGGVRIESGII